MLDGKLRIGPTCYHTLHIVPIMAAHEMNFLYDEGLKTADGSVELRARKELEPEYLRVKAVAERWGY